MVKMNKKSLEDVLDEKSKKANAKIIPVKEFTQDKNKVDPSVFNELRFCPSDAEIRKAAHRKSKQKNANSYEARTRVPEVFGEFSRRWLGLQDLSGRDNAFGFNYGWQSQMWEYFPVPVEGSFLTMLVTNWDHLLANPHEKGILTSDRIEPKQQSRSSQLFDNKAQRTPRLQCSLGSIGYYSPAHFSVSKDYGIHISSGGLVKAAEEIHRHCSIESRDVVLAATCHFVYCHLVTHAWIEDICSMLDFQYGCVKKKADRRYTRAHVSIDELHMEEEALCDISAFGLLRQFLKQPGPEIQKSRKIPRFSGKRILDAFAEWRKAASGGMSKFTPATEPPNENPEFVRRLQNLLHDGYNYPGSFDVGAVLMSALGCNLWDGLGLLPSDAPRRVDATHSIVVSDSYPVFVTVVQNRL